MVATIDDREYVSDATLLILGDELDPAFVSRSLGLRPSRSWRRGEQKRVMGLAFESKYSWGGWKKFLPPSQRHKELPGQLRYWMRTLRGRAPAFAQLTSSGLYCSLDCFLTTDATASLILPPDLQRSLSSLGLDLRFSVSVGGG